ncbi:MAG: MFS transporter [Acetobacter sp.]|uniref:MFS transporter n=1 Tax=Acetobacter sp. TaxID=440 RepID=UPI003F92B145
MPVTPRAACLATRLAFLLGGFGLACWAPLVPFAQERLHTDAGAIGSLLLCLGTGSVLAMLGTGALNSRFGSKPLIVTGALGLAITLPGLAVAPTALFLAVVLLFFGASLGVLDVAMNIQGTEVERLAKRPLMAGFHALFSIGGFAGAAFMTFLLSCHLPPFHSTIICSALMLIVLIYAFPHFISTKQGEGEPLFAMPRGIVLLLSLLAAIAFLAEGAMLDWGALLITSAGLLPVAKGGMGYMLFSVAMTVCRLLGDRVTARLGAATILSGGAVLAIAGIACLLLSPFKALALSGFVFIGLGIANIAPILFRRAAEQTVMPAGLAVSALTTIGYTGVLLGPAGIGFAASLITLKGAFWLLAGLLCCVPLCARRVAYAKA